MAARKSIKTNKFGEIEIIATSNKVAFHDSEKPMAKAIERKAWEDTAGHIWVKFNNRFFMLKQHWCGSFDIPWVGSADYVFGYAI